MNHDDINLAIDLAFAAMGATRDDFAVHAKTIIDAIVASGPTLINQHADNDIQLWREHKAIFTSLHRDVRNVIERYCQDFLRAQDQCAFCRNLAYFQCRCDAKVCAAHTRITDDGYCCHHCETLERL